MSIWGDRVPLWVLSKLRLNLHVSDTVYMEISLNIGSISSVWGSCAFSGLGVSLSSVRLRSCAVTCIVQCEHTQIIHLRSRIPLKVAPQVWIRGQI